MTANIHQFILDLIAANDGLWGWYQLDRALSQRGIFTAQLPAILAELVAGGLIASDGPSDKASTHYRLTEGGRNRLRDATV